MGSYLLLEGIALDLMDWMRRRAPDVSITIDSSHSLVAAGEISSGLLDLAVGYQHRVTAGVVFEHLVDERLVRVTSQPEGADWREGYIPIGWDHAFEDAQRRRIGERAHDCRVRANFIDAARAMLRREPASAYVVERTALPLIERGLVRRVEDAPLFERPAHAIYPADPTRPDIQAVALQGLREVATANEGATP